VLQLHEEASRGAVARQDVAQGRDPAAELPRTTSAAASSGIVSCATGIRRPSRAISGRDDDGLPVEREADVQLDGVGAVRLGPVEAVEGVFERLRRRPAVADDAGGSFAEEVHRGWIILAVDAPPHARPAEGRRARCPCAAARPSGPLRASRRAPRPLPPGPLHVPISTIDWLVSRESPAARYVALRDLLAARRRTPR